MVRSNLFLLVSLFVPVLKCNGEYKICKRNQRPIKSIILIEIRTFKKGNANTLGCSKF